MKTAMAIVVAGFLISGSIFIAGRYKTESIGRDGFWMLDQFTGEIKICGPVKGQIKCVQNKDIL